MHYYIYIIVVQYIVISLIVEVMDFDQSKYESSNFNVDLFI